MSLHDKYNSPEIWTIDNECKNNKLIFELVPLCMEEVNVILEKLTFYLDS